MPDIEVLLLCACESSYMERLELMYWIEDFVGSLVVCMEFVDGARARLFLFLLL